jgi:hypothetical protein
VPGLWRPSGVKSSWALAALLRSGCALRAPVDGNALRFRLRKGGNGVTLWLARGYASGSPCKQREDPIP